jgi:hypothetical protein
LTLGSCDSIEQTRPSFASLTSHGEPASLVTLPNEVFFAILDFLPRSGQASLTRVSYRLLQLVSAALYEDMTLSRKVAAFFLVSKVSGHPLCHGFGAEENRH